MRIYKRDGTFIENVPDTEFGWYFCEIVIDESDAKFEEINKETRYLAKLRKSISKHYESEDLLSFDEIDDVPIERISPDIETKTRSNEEEQTYEEILDSVDINFPPKEKLAELVNPCNAETKTLLAVINYSKFKTLIKGETTGKLMKNLNAKTTNFKNLINDKRASITQDMFNEIINYHATKEDNMMSLMMELILTDVDCDIEDIVDEDEPQKKTVLPQFVLQTSDLGDSPPSIERRKAESRIDNNYLQVSNRSDILNSIGLGEEDKSIQSFCEETFQMHQELADIKKSFQEDDNKVNDLLKQVCALKNDLKETLYLNDIINLLEGDVEKVKLRQLPFRIFYDRIEGHHEFNLII